MTPLSRFYARWLPDWLVWPMVTLTYAFGLLLLFFGAQAPDENIIYIDLQVEH